MNRLTRGALLTAGVFALGCGSGDNKGQDAGVSDAGVITDVACNADALTSALAAASPGETVLLGECELTGSFTVGPGVSLQGAGVGQTVIVAAPGDIALELVQSDAHTTLRDMTVRSDGWMAVSATDTGAGTVELRDLRAEITRGFGVGIDGPENVILDTVEIRGSLTAQNPPPVPQTEQERATLHTMTPFYGLDVRSATAEISDVVVSGFAEIGVIFVDSEVTWNGGEVCDNFHNSMRTEGGNVSLSNIGIRRTLNTSRSLTVGIWALAGAHVETDLVEIVDNEGFGLVQIAATTSHQDVTANGNGGVAMWIQESTGFEIVGMNGFMADNQLAGVVLKDSSNSSISNLTIETTVAVPTIVGMNVVTVGDGIQVIDSYDSLSIQSTNVTNNERTGVLLVASDGNIPNGIFSTVTAESSAGQLGVVAQSADAVIPAGDTWDEGVARLGSAATDDLAHNNVLFTASQIVGMNGIVAPPPLTDTSL